jgi:hypothetical protein
MSNLFPSYLKMAQPNPLENRVPFVTRQYDGHQPKNY